MIDAIIIENELEATKFLKILIEKVNIPINIKGYASSIKEGINLISAFKPNLIFLDIELDDGLGFEILDFFPNPEFDIFFITASDNYYKQAFKHFAFTYIKKPFDLETLEYALHKYKLKRNIEIPNLKGLKSFLDKENPILLIQSRNVYHSILLKNIIYFKAEGNYSKVLTSTKEQFLANYGLVHYNKLLEFKGFFRASRSYLVNITHIKSIYKKEYIILHNNKRISVSVRNREKLIDLINLLN